MADPLAGTQLLEAMKSYAQGVLKGNTADTLGAPVDLINEAISPITKRLGMYSEEPIGGSKQFRKLLNQNVEDKNLAETTGSMLSIGGAAKAMIIGAARLGKVGKVDIDKFTNFQKVAGDFPVSSQTKADLYNNTGVYRDKGADKAVISDKDSKIIPNSMGSFEQPSSLAGVLDHPELFSLYPELKKTGVYYDPKLSGVAAMGQYWPHSNEIGVRPDITGEELRSVMLHEVQHRIQAIEGWQSGGNTRQFIPFKPDVVQQRINAARQSNDPAVRDAAERFKTIANMKVREAGNRYSNLPGEQEARYTQETMNMSLPELTNDVLALIRSGNTPTTYDTRPIRPVFGGGDVVIKP